MEAEREDLDDFRVPFFDAGAQPAGAPFASPFSLEDYAASLTPRQGAHGGAWATQRVDAISRDIAGLQKRLFAQKQPRVLLVLQGMDTSGKDSTIRAVFREVNPAGVNVVSFRPPSEEEAAHDFLWRIHRHAPAAGTIAVFNRSHYEDVLVPRVTGTLDAAAAERRFAQIRAFEALLADAGTTVLKCFLHISKDVQRARLQARIDRPEKNWKFDPADLDARRQWDAYRSAYDAALAATSTSHAPWYVVPADSKAHRKLMVAELLLRALRALDPAYPPARAALAGFKVV
ncbi:MAG: PPK2 family polyphosphate kinase [Janthinobacterium lividum]